MIAENIFIDKKCSLIEYIQIFRAENHEEMTVGAFLLNIISIKAQTLHDNSENSYQWRYFFGRMIDPSSDGYDERLSDAKIDPVHLIQNVNIHGDYVLKNVFFNDTLDIFNEK